MLPIKYPVEIDVFHLFFANFAFSFQGFIMLLQRIYNPVNRKDLLSSRIYDYFMLPMIITSVVPLMFVDDYPIFRIIEIVTVLVFIIDYLLRWITSGMLLKKGWLSYIIYPFMPMAIIDLLSILPGLNLIDTSFKLLRLTRLLKIVRLLKVFRYSGKITMFFTVLVKERQVLLSVLMLALFYIFITALVMFNAEPHINPNTGAATFRSFFDALYWATVTLTTVGYGDLCPVTNIGGGGVDALVAFWRCYHRPAFGRYHCELSRRTTQNRKRGLRKD